MSVITRQCLDYADIASRLNKRGTSRAITKYTEKLCLCSGISNKSNHKIRKTQISSMFDGKININTIRELSGHKDERTSVNKSFTEEKIRNAVISTLLSLKNK